MTENEWKRICADRFLQRAELEPDEAESIAAECFELCQDDGGFLKHDPEDAADLEMSYWDDC